MVSEDASVPWSQGMAVGGPGRRLRGDGRPDSRTLRPRSRTGVRRGVLPGVLEARTSRLEAVSPMGRKTGEKCCPSLVPRDKLAMVHTTAGHPSSKGNLHQVLRPNKYLTLQVQK